MQQNGPKPYPESMIALIQGLKSGNQYISDKQLMYAFAEIILTTEILYGHDELIAAWQMGAFRYGISHDLGVVESIKAQKQAQEENNMTSVRKTGT